MRNILSLFLLIIFTFPAYGENKMTEYKKATFAGGCFWCMEKPFDKLDGVLSTTSGYIGGHVKNPTYEQVSSGVTGHIESLQVIYDPKKITYKELLDVYWVNIDPIDARGQFCDKGEQYTSAIFYHDKEQEKEASLSKEAVEKDLGLNVATNLRPAEIFYPAEDYHQNYYQKNPIRYKYYRNGCGRDRRLKEIWK